MGGETNDNRRKVSLGDEKALLFAGDKMLLAVQHSSVLQLFPADAT